MTIPQQQAKASESPVTYDHAETVYHSDLRGATERYSELSQRDLSARAAAILRERGEFEPENNLGHRELARREPLNAADHLEHMALGELLARYYRHPSMLDQAAKAGASWEQIGAARGTSADQARQDYRAWADGQHSLLSWSDGKFGMTDADYAAAYARSADPTTDPDGIGDPARIGIHRGAAQAYAATHRVLCAHADQDGAGSHWLEPGERCATLGGAAAARRPGSEQEHALRPGAPPVTSRPHHKAPDLKSSTASGTSAASSATVQSRRHTRRAARF
jgi:hypothetical protein